MTVATCDDVGSTPGERQICRVEDVPLGLGRAFRIDGLDIAIFRSRAGAVHAVENRCPHRGGPLADGMLAGDRVVCPFHGFRYDLHTGECDQPASCAARTFSARVHNGWVLLSTTVTDTTP